MRLAASLVMTGISIGLLAVYGADVAVAQGDGEGFLPFDHKTRGLGLGLPSIILPIASFFISRNDPSKPLGGLVIAAGILIMIGGLAVLTLADPVEAKSEGRSLVSEAAPLLGIGAVIVALGAIKLKRS